MIHGPVSGSDKLDRFTETNANRGSLGIFKSRNLIRYMMANAKLFDKVRSVKNGYGIRDA
jgi:2,3-bisphosphoglycerate-independent phosphoglycerate mutase